MLEFHPRSSFNWKFDVIQKRQGMDDRTAVVEILPLRQRGAIRYGEESIDIGSLGILSKKYKAHRGDQKLFDAELISWWRRGYVFTIGNHEWRLEPNSAFRREYHLTLNGEIAGRVKPESSLRRRGTADFPDELPFEVQLICLWLVLAAWKRASDSAVVAGS